MQDTDEGRRRIAEIKATEDLPEPPACAQTLDLSIQTSVPDMVKQVQRYIEAFQYNYTGKPFIRMNKSRGVSHIHNVSKQLIKESLPIQCVEAVFLGTTLTSGINDLTRVPLSFKSKFVKGTVHRHIALAVKFEGKWGAIGISRRSSLMNKPIKFNSLSALVDEYRKSYEACYKLLTCTSGCTCLTTSSWTTPSSGGPPDPPLQPQGGGGRGRGLLRGQHAEAIRVLCAGRMPSIATNAQACPLPSTVVIKVSIFYCKSCTKCTNMIL